MNNLKFVKIPNKADIRVTLPPISAKKFKGQLMQMGLTADDLTPIDWREKAQLSPVKNQQDCGICWAMSTTSMLTDKFRIHKNIQYLDLCPIITGQCCMAGDPLQENSACEGGYPGMACEFFEKYGCVDASSPCLSWPEFCPEKCSGDNPCCTNLPTCQTISEMCKPNKVYKAVPGSTRTTIVQSGSGVDAEGTILKMKTELLDGPIVIGFMVSADWMVGDYSSTNNIYINGAYNDILESRFTNEQKAQLTQGAEWNTPNLGGHAMEVVGWGKGNAGPYGEVSYWIIKNSWGTDWGKEGGYCKFAMYPVGDTLYPKNWQNTGLDVPLAMGNQFFGSGTTCSVDINTGEENGFVYDPKVGEEVSLYDNVISSVSNYKTQIIIFLVLAGLFYYFVLRKQ